jgi:hypothetical protein
MADYADLLAAEKKQSGKPPAKPVNAPVKTGTSEPATAKKETVEESKQASRHDVTTSSHHDVNYRAWRDVIENTETQNSALRLTREERYEIEDLVSDLERKHKIKTSMNELARLGLLHILHDYKTNKTESLVFKVKKS